MSFQDLEVGTLPPAPASQVVAHAVFQINTKVALLRQLGDGLGTHKDTPALRGRIRRTRADVTRLAKSTSEKIKQAAAGAGGDLHRPRASASAAEDVAPGSKLAMDFEAALREFQQVQQRIVAAERQEIAAAYHHNPPARIKEIATAYHHRPPAPTKEIATAYNHHPPARSEGAADTLASQQWTAQEQTQLLVPTSQELVVLDSEIAFNEALIEEREQGIREVQEEIAEIHEIFKDLAMLVHDQGECIQLVESNLDRTAAATSQAEEQLSKAAPIQKSGSSTKCLLLIVLSIVLFIVLVVLV